MYSSPHDYIVTDHKNGKPRCRGCGIVIQPGTIRIVAKASFKEANTTYPVHVSNIIIQWTYNQDMFILYLPEVCTLKTNTDNGIASVQGNHQSSRRSNYS